MATNVPPPPRRLSEPEIQAHVARSRGGEEAAFAVLLGQFQGMRDHWSAALQRCGVTAEDADQEMRIALYESCQKFDPARGCKFFTFAWRHCLHVVNNARRQHESYFGAKERGRLRQQELAAAMDRFQATHGTAPSLQEVAEAEGWGYAWLVSAAYWMRSPHYVQALDAMKLYDEDSTERQLMAPEDGAEKVPLVAEDFVHALRGLSAVDRAFLQEILLGMPRGESAARIGQSKSMVTWYRNRTLARAQVLLEAAGYTI